jgi:uncharacterized iron-regulated protein
MALPDSHLTRRRFIKASAATVITTSYAQPVDTEVKLAGLPPVNIFAGNSGAPRSWEQVFAAMDAADVIVIGESHTDAKGHAIQIDLIKLAVQRWRGITVSVEEFDRSQQPDLDAFARGDLTGAQLKETRSFVDLQVKANWQNWYLPKVAAARDADAPLLASNAPLKYSRMVRNYGCDDLPELSAAERALFECPSVPIDPVYREGFAKTFRQAVKRGPDSGLKELNDEQIDVLFRAHRVWDATMAESIVQAQAAGANKVLHLVGNFHSDFNGGLIQELRARDKDSRILVLSMRARRGSRMSKSDMGRADMVIYTMS